MSKNYSNAPLPFMGQKRRFLKQFKECLNTNKTATIYVDLFGGSGLLAHTVKNHKPASRVIYNDYDNYSYRIANIGKTNEIVQQLREITAELPRNKRITGKHKELILELIGKYEKEGFVDYITLSSSLLFSMNYVTTYAELCKQTLYNTVRKNDYSAEGYLDGIEVVSEDYKHLFEQYKDVPGVVFLVDPPYLSTESGTYNNYWKLRDYLDVLTVLKNNDYYYFTSNKSHIIELCEWIESQVSFANPFYGSTTYTTDNRPSYNTAFTDMMLVKQPDDLPLKQRKSQRKFENKEVSVEKIENDYNKLTRLGN